RADGRRNRVRRIELCRPGRCRARRTRHHLLARERRLSVYLADLPFDDSRRLTGFNLYFSGVGAVMETLGVEPDEGLADGWRTRVSRARAALGWAEARLVIRRHASGASLALGAPLDQLFAATEVNEWAWLATLADEHGVDVGLHAPGHPAAWDESSA